MNARLPVIVGVGEIVDRPDDLARSLEPLALMGAALGHAEDDAGADLIANLDSLDIVHQVSWRYEKTAAALCARLGIQPARAVYGVTGGESPMRYLHEAALRIVRGESEIAAIVGAEAQYAVNKAKQGGIDLPWTPIAADVENPYLTAGRLNPVAMAHGVVRPIHTYPLYENASSNAWGQTPAEALAESSALWSRFSSVAASNPYAWSKRMFAPADIATVSADNRLICFPYTKRVVANPAVNQGAAVVLMSLERARALNIAESRMIHIWGGASAMEPRDYFARDRYTRSDAQDAVLNAAISIAHDNGRECDALELYSCFPCVPKMTRRVLGLPADVTPTVTGGLSFFGAPLNNYMTHAACAMVRHMRTGRARTGLLYGQGEIVTKHHAVVLGREPPRAELAREYSVQADVDRRRDSVPVLLTDYRGPATIETHTVMYDREVDLHGVVIARTPNNERLMARMSSRDAIATLTNAACSPIGLRVDVIADNGLLLADFA